MSYPERIVPDETAPGILAIHLKRYAFALPWCAGRDVLDIACGMGYGTAFLAGAARRVVGGDLSDDAVGYARSRYARLNAEFEVMDAAALPFADGSFDVVCSFETIEHLSDRDAYLAEVVRVLRDGGVYLVSTPRADSTTAAPDNPYHTVEYDIGDFRELLGRYFQDVELYGQRRIQTRRHRVLQRLDVLGLRRKIRVPRAAVHLVGTAPTADVALEGILIEPHNLEHATELVAVCTLPRRG